MLGWKAAGLSPFWKLGFSKLIIHSLMADKTIRFNKMYKTNTRNSLRNTFFRSRLVLMRSSRNQNNRKRIPCSLQNMDMKVMVESVRNLAAVAGVVSGCQDRQRREELESCYSPLSLLSPAPAWQLTLSPDPLFDLSSYVKPTWPDTVSFLSPNIV